MTDRRASRWWLLFAALGVVAGLVRVAVAFRHDQLSSVVGLAAAVVICVVVVVGVAWVYGRPVARARREYPTAWARLCTDPLTPYARLVLLIDDHGVAVLDAHGAARERWPYTQITAAALGPVRMPRALVDRPGLVITADGRTRRFLLYGPLMLTTPKEPIQEAVTLIASHRRGRPPTATDLGRLTG